MYIHPNAHDNYISPKKTKKQVDFSKNQVSRKVRARSLNPEQVLEQKLQRQYRMHKRIVALHTDMKTGKHVLVIEEL